MAIFEDQFMEIQIGMVSLAMEYVNGQADAIYIYGISEKEIISYNVFFKINVYEVLEDIEDRLPSTLFPFGEDPFGNLLCFDYSDNQSVVYWNHEMLDNNGHNTVFVAQSFTDFINSLYFDNE